MPFTLTLSGKVALITGGSRGIGAATVRMFVAAGAKVLFSYEKAATTAAGLIKELGEVNCAAAACNLSGTDTALQLVDTTIKRFGRLDILIANHGVWPPQDAPIDQMSEAQWRNTVAINLDSVFALIKHSVAQMKLALPLATSCSSVPPPANAEKHFTPTTRPPKEPSSAWSKGFLLSSRKMVFTSIASRPAGWRRRCRLMPLTTPGLATSSSKPFHSAGWQSRKRSLHPSCFCALRRRDSSPGKCST